METLRSLPRTWFCGSVIFSSIIPRLVSSAPRLLLWFFLLFPYRTTALPLSCSPYSSGVPGQRSTTASPRCPTPRELIANHAEHLISVSCFHKLLGKNPQTHTELYGSFPYGVCCQAFPSHILMLLYLQIVGVNDVRLILLSMGGEV